MSDKKYFLASAAITLASAAVLITTAKKKPKKSVYTALVLAGVAGFAGAAALAYQPSRQAKKRLIVEKLVDEIDIPDLEQNISEILGGLSETVLE
ncbi:MAG: hypothetical protein E7637_00885 [Ruminococcaceae bacterium]|nr:hypothetical protein [Oscillospiraceae bacterium]